MSPILDNKAKSTTKTTDIKTILPSIAPYLASFLLFALCPKDVKKNNPPTKLSPAYMIPLQIKLPPAFVILILFTVSEIFFNPSMFLNNISKPTINENTTITVQ